MFSRRVILVAIMLIASLADATDYIVYVVCESSDRIVRVRFGPGGIHVEKEISTSLAQSDISGPHGIVTDPAHDAYYVTLGHGRPNGSALKYSSRNDKLEGQVALGLFPATVDITPDGTFLFVVNFNLHGDMVPSSVSVVETSQMLEVARIPTCTMPHGSRINPQGTEQYSACMMDDDLVEIDTNALRVSRYFRLSKGSEQGFTGAPHAVPVMRAKMPATCMPTWAQPSSDGSKIYVACNKSNEIVEVDVPSWKLLRRIPARDGIYNLAVAGENRLVATNKRDASVSVYDLKSGSELARIPTSTTVVHGVAISPDNHYAFVTSEGVGTKPGKLDVIDLTSLKLAASADLPPQAAGIAFWKMEPAR